MTRRERQKQRHIINVIEFIIYTDVYKLCDVRNVFTHASNNHCGNRKKAVG